MANLDQDCQDWLERCLADDTKSDVDDSPTFSSEDSIFDKSPDERKGTYSRLRSASKPHSTPLTLKWLEENYEIAEGVCIPRSTLYVHYLDYCEKNDTQPVNAASFGKIIRQQFPQLTTRRLGTRGQSKYHYYGIGVREDSRYYEVTYSAKGIQSNSDGKKDNSKQIIAYSPRSKLGTLLPDFPDIKDIKLPPSVAEDKVLTFLMMYRTHCQRILDTVIRANFDEVQNFLLHFWQGMPTHIKSILECRTLVTLVGVCDTILYTAIANVLMPTVLQPLPDSLTQVIRKFSVQLYDWLRHALDSLPHNLQKIKFDLARRFSQVLKRQTSLNHLCQAARTVIHSAEITSQMLDDWLNVDLNSIVKQTLYTMAYTNDTEHDVIVSVIRDFELLLEEQASLESYIDWLDNMVDRCVVKKSKKQSISLNKLARQFLLMWSCFGTRIIRDMTLHSAPSFGSFHLLHLMFDEYVLYTVENLHNQEKASELLSAVRGDITLDFLDDNVQPESDVIKAGCYVTNQSSDKSPTTDTVRNPAARVTDCGNTFGPQNIQVGYTPNCHGDGTTFLQQTRMDISASVNGSQGVGDDSTYQGYGNSNISTRHKQTTSFQNHMGLLSYAPSSSSFVSNCQSTNAYDWSDWSVTDQFQPTGQCSLPRMATHINPSSQVFESKTTSGLVEQFCGGGIQNGCSPTDISLRRGSYFEQNALKRKTNNVQNNTCGGKQYMDSFSYDVGNIM